MKHIALFLGMFLIAALCRAGDYRTFTVTTGTNAAAAVTGYADPFTGDIDEISVYTDAGVTGAVAVAVIDPYSSDALVLATNATVTSRMTWKPRTMAPAITGATSLVVTNTATADRFNAQGEKLRMIVSAASKTSSVFRVFIKIKGN